MTYITFIPYCLAILLGVGIFIGIHSQKGFKNPMTATTMLMAFLGAIVYYGHLHPTMENLKREPIKVYKTVPLKTPRIAIGEGSALDVVADADETLEHEVQRKTLTTMEDKDTYPSPDSTDTEGHRIHTRSNEDNIMSPKQGDLQPSDSSEEILDEAEELEALRAEVTADLAETEDLLERGNKMLREALPQMVHYLNSMPLEEQKVTFKQMRIELEKASQGDNNPELMEQAWQLTLDMFIDGGYTGYIPSK
ncbi:MAG: hypothetical protein OXU51_13430 [Candidatus Poribacteria bacterium]|nr:hypothetical protein [Candidatus Poribacteria bacterium]